MSLYYEAAAFISDESSAKASLKTRIFCSKTLKSKPTHVYALISNGTKWSQILKAIIEKAEILKLERKLTPALALLLTHDLLLSKDGVAAPKNHVLKIAISKHRARLSAEFTRARLKAGFASVEAWRAYLDEAPDALNRNVETGSSKVYRHPRWIRINTLKTSITEELATTFAGYEQASTLEAILRAPATAKLFKLDDHVPSLLALPPGTNLSKSKAYLDGKLIFQDKASCMPAYLLDYQPSDGDCIDTCAAPGNKTTHLAALLQDHLSEHPSSVPQAYRRPQIWACERDKQRSATLQKMVARAGASSLVTCLAAQDFLDLDPAAPQWSRVTALLLDPSCSGSGIIGRGDDTDDDEDHGEHDISTPNLALPSRTAPSPPTLGRKKPKSKSKSKSNSSGPIPLPLPPPNAPQSPTSTPTPTPTQSTPSSHPHPLAARLAALSAFQTRLLTHAMAFPAARRISYSTCSRHAAENEGVLLRALAAPARHGWRVLRREEQVRGMRAWERRGDVGFCLGWRGGVGGDGDDGSGDGDGDGKQRGGGGMGLSEAQRAQRAQIAEACVRCEKGTGEGTMGFFVVCLVRDEGEGDGEEGGETAAMDGEDEVWEGLSD